MGGRWTVTLPKDGGEVLNRRRERRRERRKRVPLVKDKKRKHEVLIKVRTV